MIWQNLILLWLHCTSLLSFPPNSFCVWVSRISCSQSLNYNKPLYKDCLIQTEMAQYVLITLQIRSIKCSHCCHIFLWLCIWGGCTFIFCQLLHLHPRKTGSLFPLLLISRRWCVQIFVYIMGQRSYFFAHHTTSLSSLCGHIWKHRTHKCLSGIFCPVCV